MVEKIFEIEFNDGAVFKGDSFFTLVDAMKNASFFTIGKTTEEYMRGYALRTLMAFSDESIDASHPVNFILSVAVSPECRAFRIQTKLTKVG